MPNVPRIGGANEPPNVKMPIIIDKARAVKDFATPE